MKIVENKEKKGIELYFDGKPKSEVLSNLKDNHFRWHSMKKCWYARDNEQTRTIANDIISGKELAKVEAKNENYLGIKVGDIFYMSWGYEQTNNDFFVVKELKGSTMVVLQEVVLRLSKEEGIGSMSSDRYYDINCYEISKNSCFVKDNDKGMLKKILGTKECPYINMTSYANAYKYNGEKLYESWYY